MRSSSGGETSLEQGTHTDPSNPRSVALQTMWRSCGTYIWSKFREKPEFCTYVEPLHEKLLHGTSESFQAERNDGIENRLRHPAIEQHYFAEYPFQPEGGVALFRKRFSFEHYFLRVDEKDDELAKYLSRLDAYARWQQKRPLFKFCRFGLRTAWLVRNMGPVVIYIVRDPDAMFRSYWSFGGTQSYFIFALAHIVSKNRDCGLFTESAVRFGIPHVKRASVAEEMSEIHSLTRDFDPQIWRDLFLLLWALHLQHNIAHCDLLLDMDLLATCEPYRKEIEKRLVDLTGTPLSFAGAPQSRSAEAPGILVSPSGRELARHALQKLSEKTRFDAVDTLSDSARRTLEMLLY